MDILRGSLQRCKAADLIQRMPRTLQQRDIDDQTVDLIAEADRSERTVPAIETVLIGVQLRRELRAGRS